MENDHVYYGYLDIYDDHIFTQNRINEWKQHLLNCYEDIYNGLTNKLDHECPVCFNLSLSLFDEVIVDAVIGMRKIVNSLNNTVEDPNAFKIAAYLSYWWLRHKPVSVHYPADYRLEYVHVANTEELNGEAIQKEDQKLCWQLKHINELVAVQIVSTYIFDFDNVICGNGICKQVKHKEKEKFEFASFEEMRDELLKKLTYYFSYRAIAPKIIEHILEAYTLHPAWGLTGRLWAKKENKE